MLRGTVARRLRRLASIGLALYAVFLLTTPFEHHDLSCEIKTPQHCMACSSSVVGADPHTPATPGVSTLVDAGVATSLDTQATSVLLVARTTGRSPPAAL